MVLLPASALSDNQAATWEELKPVLLPALAALCRARPVDPVVFLAQQLLARKPPELAMPPALFVLDAGSLHTKLFQYIVVGKEVRSMAKPMKLLRDPRTSLSLGRDILATSDFDLFFSVLDATLGTRRAPVRLFIGATNGVRKNLDRGEVTPRTINAFSAAVSARYGQHASFAVLTGEQEAACEYAAAAHVYGPLFAEHGMGDVRMLAGGGSSVQIMAGVNLAVSLTLETRPLEDAARAELASSSGCRPERVVSEARERFGSVISEAAAHLTPIVASGSAFVGIAMFSDLSDLGYADQWLSKLELMHVLSTLLDELIAGVADGTPSGAWRAAQAKWGKRLLEPPERALWSIGMIGLLRLLAVLKPFGDACMFYFPAPGDPQPDWPLGYHCMKLL